MGTLNNQNPNLYPNRTLPNSNPIVSTNPNPIPNPVTGPKSPSFEEVSKLFSLPLSDAADSLGICPSVLKKVCYDNGLVRWPYRKYAQRFLSGKSIEEIKKDAVVEKEKKLTELKASGERNVSLASSAVLSPLGPQPQSTKTGSLQGSPGLRTLTQPPTKNTQLESSHILSSTMNKVNAPVSDEFKYGFPSSGLSNISYRWWGNKNADDNVVDSKESAIEDADQNEKQPKDFEYTTSSLSALRTKAVKNGQQALKLRVYRGWGVKSLDQAKKRMLLQIFKSLLPDERGDDVSTEI
ncbi:hypothetical protein CASFOL_017685 [Castilleja foliolosa]|uniref:RWP-RK domain-containing protein n=1 Tax=Castilleja foliolosa TaxID=1961234 RepID=A0ABD3DAQ8_9LAMI